MVEQGSISILNLIGTATHLKRVAATNGGEWAGTCPFCGGRDRFRVWASQNTWWCRGCERKGDAIAFVMQYQNLDFKAAADYLKLELPKLHNKSNRSTNSHAKKLDDVHTSELEDGKAFLDPRWQSAADSFVTRSVLALYDGHGSAVREYLEARGINLSLAASVDLGYNPVDTHEMWGDTKVWLPRGIVIPWQIDGVYWRIRIRRSPKDLKPDDSKYINSAGGGNGLYLADPVEPHNIVIVTEGEFDALLVHQAAINLRARGVRAVATGGTKNARLLRWVSLLSLARLVLIAFDRDANQAGDLAAGWWQRALKTNVQRPNMPDHDITDAWKCGGDELINDWLKGEVRCFLGGNREHSNRG